MASRRSSILKPRKAREPLQDLNQLLPNNDDEETTTTGFPKRRVSFASINKVKEFEAAAECVTLLNTPAYDERFSISSDSSSLLGPSQAESQKSTKETSLRDNVEEEDIEITETVGRIYEVSMKGRSDSSMELTHIITPNKSINPNAMEQTMSPLNLSKNTNRSEVIDCNSSCMETTEVVAHNFLAETLISESCRYNEDTENISCGINVPYDSQNMEVSPYVEVLPASRKSIFHRDQGVPARKSIFDSPVHLPKLDILNDEENVHVKELIDAENVSMEMSILQIEENEEIASLRTIASPAKPNRNIKSIFSQSDVAHDLKIQSPINTDDVLKKTNLTNLKETIVANSYRRSLPVISQNLAHKHEHHNVSMQSLSQYSNRTQYNNSSMHLMSQEVEPKIESNRNTRAIDISMNRELVQENVEQTQNVTRYDHSNMQFVIEEVSGKIEINESSLDSTQPVNQNENKTRYDHSNMQFVSQDVIEKSEPNIDNTRLVGQNENVTQYDHSNMQFVTQEMSGKTESDLTSQCENKTRYDNSNMQLLSQEMNENSHMQLVSQDVGGKIEVEDYGLVLPVGEKPLDKTEYLNRSMQLASQEVCGKVEVENIDAQAITDSKLLDKTECLNRSMQLASQHDGKVEIEQIISQSENKLKRDTSNMQLTMQVPDDRTLFDEKVEETTNKYANTEQQKTNNDQSITTDVFENDADETKSDIQKSYNEANTSCATNDSNSPLTVGVNFSIFQKNKETRVEFSGVIDSNKKERSKSISNVQVNIINNKVEKKNGNVQKLRFSMPASKATMNENKPRVYASFTDVSVPSTKYEDDIQTSKRELHSSILSCQEVTSEGLEDVKLMSPIIEQESLVLSAETNECTTDKREIMPTKKRLSSEMLDAGEEQLTTLKRRSLPTNERRSLSGLPISETNDEVTATAAATVEPHSPPAASNEDESNHIESVNLRDVSSSTFVVEKNVQEIKHRRESVVFEDNSSVVTMEKVIVETCSKFQSLSCTTSTNEEYLLSQDISSPVDKRSRRSSTFEKAHEAQSVKEDEVQHSKTESTNLTDKTSLNVRSPSSKNVDPEINKNSSFGVQSNKSEVVSHKVNRKISLSLPSVPFETVDHKTNRKSSLGLQSVSPETVDHKASNETLLSLPSVSPQNVGDKPNIKSLLTVPTASLENTNDKTVKRKSLSVGKTSSDKEPQVEDRSVVLGCDQSIGDMQSTPYHKRSFKSMGSYSMLEDELLDPLNNPSIMVNVGDSFLHCRSLDLDTESVSATETREASKRNDGENVKNVIENILSDNVSKINFVSDWLQKGKFENTNCCKLLEEDKSTASSIGSGNLSKDSHKDISLVTNFVEPISKKKEAKVQKEEPAVESSTGSTEESQGVATTVEPYQSSIPEASTAASDQLVENESDDDKVHSMEKEDIEVDQEVIIETDVEILSEDVNQIDHEEKVEDLMEISSASIAVEENKCGVAKGETSIVGHNDLTFGSPSTETSNVYENEFAIEDAKKEIMEKVREEYRSGHTEWRLKATSTNEWIFQVSERGYLQLIVTFKSTLTDCCARFKFNSKPTDAHYEIMKIAINTLIQKSRSKLRTLCRRVEDIPCLLKLIMPDVMWTTKFFYDLRIIGGVEDVRFKNGKVTFSIASFKTHVLFDVRMEMRDLNALSVNDIDVEVRVGAVNKNLVLKIFSEVGRNYDFLSKFIKKLNDTFCAGGFE